MKVADLRAIVEAMTPGPYRYDDRGWIESMDRGINHTGSETEVLILGARNLHEDGIGVVELCNHATAILDVLELAERLIDDGLTLGQQHAARVALRCALAKLEAVQ